MNVYDAHLKAGDRITAPSSQGWRQWLYVMHGTVEVGGQSLEKGDRDGWNSQLLVTAA